MVHAIFINYAEVQWIRSALLSLQDTVAQSVFIKCSYFVKHSLRGKGNEDKDQRGALCFLRGLLCSVSSVSWLCPRGRSPSSVSDLLCIPWNKNVWGHCSEVIVCQASDFKRSKLLRTLRTAKQETFLVPFLPWAPSGWVSLSTVQSLYCRMAT